MQINNLNSRTGKIKFLRLLQAGTASINEVMPMKIEDWYHTLHDPDTYINEQTGERITAAQMDEKEKMKGKNNIFLTIKTYEDETQRPKK